MNLLSQASGRIHSFEAGSVVDGPGVRFVIFTQGCPLRCQYCHNPDTRDPQGGFEISVDELISEIIKYRPYFDASGGGVTVSGGEPLLQAGFTGEIFRRCRELGIATALDTSGVFPKEALALTLPWTDLVLLDIKSWNRQTYHQVTHVDIDPTLQFAQILQENKIPLWVRFVLVPGLTDQAENIEGVAKYCSTLPNLQRLDVLPFHKLGEYKWHTMGLPYTLSQTQPPTSEQMDRVRAVFKQYLNCAGLGS